jgi:hypothetical protein
MANESRLDGILSTVTVATVTALLLFPSAAFSADKDSAPVPPQSALNLHFACRGDNDLYRVMTADGCKYARHATASKAVQAAPEGGGVLILADGYPEKTTNITRTSLDVARAKKLRLYIEYPARSAIDRLEFGEPQKPNWARTVVATDFFGSKLEKLRILQINDCHFLPVRLKGTPAHLVSSRVAGYDSAVYGLTEESWPLLFEHDVDQGAVLIATTKLSQFVSARYAPSDDWATVCRSILSWLVPDEKVTPMQWTATVRPSFDRDTALPPNEEAKSLKRGVKWFDNFLVGESWSADLAQPSDDTYGPTDPRRRTGLPVGDGRHGILEGHISKIFTDGSQPMRWLLRGDCNAESAMAFALGGHLHNDLDQQKVAANLMDFVYFDSDLYQSDPNSPTYGLLGWFSYRSGPDSFWGNDGSKAIIGSFTTAAALQNSRWDERILTGILANFRTTGPMGFRDGMPLSTRSLNQHGWEYFAARRSIAPWPQREAWAWACYLWLYDKTRYQPLLEQARNALRMTMERYPDGWGYALNEMQMERGRILLPLAWLVRVDDTAEHRQWLRRVTDDMLVRLDDSGAIQEQLRATSHSDNADYGTGEVSILHADGDPCADVFYSIPPAFLGLVEAAAATGDPIYSQAADKVAEFLIRVQVRSEDHPTLDGGWFRAFDYEKWDYWGGNGDSGWGAWSSETGWVQSHIVAAMAMREKKTSLWDFTSMTSIGDHFAKYQSSMEIDRAVSIMRQAAPEEIDHLARGKPVQANIKPHPRHPGAGLAGLTDGLLGEEKDLRLEWMGFRGSDLEATIDLGRKMPLKSVSVRFLQSVADGMVQPRRVECLVSNDGKTFRLLAASVIDVPIDRDSKGLSVKPRVLRPEPNQGNASNHARFVRLHVESPGALPAWHPAADNPSWLFVDEIVVE